MEDRYKNIEKKIQEWFSFKLPESVNDIMPDLIFLYEENKKLKKIIDNHNFS